MVIKAKFLWPTPEAQPVVDLLEPSSSASNFLSSAGLRTTFGLHALHHRPLSRIFQDQTETCYEYDGQQFFMDVLHMVEKAISTAHSASLSFHPHATDEIRVGVLCFMNEGQHSLLLILCLPC